MPISVNLAWTLALCFFPASWNSMDACVEHVEQEIRKQVYFFYVSNQYEVLLYYYTLLSESQHLQKSQNFLAWDTQYSVL